MCRRKEHLVLVRMVARINVVARVKAIAAVATYPMVIVVGCKSIGTAENVGATKENSIAIVRGNGQAHIIPILRIVDTEFETRYKRATIIRYIRAAVLP